MEQWSKILIEWINCLNVLKEPIKEIKDLKDNKFYVQIIQQLNHDKNFSSNPVNLNIDIINFIKKEYPLFEISDKENDNNQVYIASLLLLHISQNEIFHKPMCTNLKHESQVKIKDFLELVLPSEKNVTVDILNDAIIELKDVLTENIPVTPKSQTLKDFLMSPIARCTHSQRKFVERDSELRKLRNELEIERFEKIDLQEDIYNQERKIQNLQKKLQEKMIEIQMLKDEKLKSSTPLKCKADANQSNFHKKQIEIMEEHCTKVELQLETLEIENEKLLKSFKCIEEERNILKDKCLYLENELSTLSSLMEYRDKELLDFKINNEELRNCLYECNKNNQSYEVEGSMLLTSQSSGSNSGEVLSTVIEVQLQETKNECSNLKTELNSLKCALKSATDDLNDLKKVNSELQTQLNIAEKKLLSSSEELKLLQQDKISLTNICKNLEDDILSKKEQMAQSEKSIADLNIEINNLKKEENCLKESLQEEYFKESELNNLLSHAKLEQKENCYLIEKLKNENQCYKMEIENFKINFKDIIQHCNLGIDVDGIVELSLNEQLSKLETVLSEFQELNELNENKIMILNARLDDTKNIVKELENQISEVQKAEIQQTKKISNLHDLIKEKDTLISEHESSTSMSKEKIKELIKENEKITLDFEALSKVYEQLQKEFSDVSLMLEIKENNNKKFTSEIENLNQENKRLIDAQEIKELEVKTLKQSFEKEISEKKNSYDESTKMIAELKSKLLESENNIKTLINEKNSLNGIIKELIKSINDTASIQVATMVKQEKALNITSSNLEKVTLQFNSLKSNICKHFENEKQSKINLKNDYSGLQEQNAENIKVIKSLNIELGLKIKELEENKKCLQEETKKKMESEKISEQLKSSIDNLNEELMLKKQELQENKEYLQKEQDERCGIENSLENLKIIVSTLKEDLNSKVHELEEYKKCLQDKNRTEIENEKILEQLKTCINNLHSVRFETNENIQTNTENSYPLLIKEENNILNLVQLVIEELNLSQKTNKDVLNKLKHVEENLIKQTDICKNLEEVEKENSLIKCKLEQLTNDQSINELVALRESTSNDLSSLKDKWISISKDSEKLLLTPDSNFDELKDLLAKKNEIDDILYDHEITFIENFMPSNDLLWKTFLNMINQIININIKEPNLININCHPIRCEINKIQNVQDEIIRTQERVEIFSVLISACKQNLKRDNIKQEFQLETQKSQIDQLLKEKIDLKNRLNTMRLRCTKLEKNLDELRIETKKLKVDDSEKSEDVVENLKKEIAHLKADNQHLLNEKNENEQKLKLNDSKDKLKEVHAKYELKLEDLKQKMKAAYNDQVAKLMQEHEKKLKGEIEPLKEKMQKQCESHMVEINRYKSHVTQLTSHIWNLGEKLLTEKQQKTEAIEKLNEIQQIPQIKLEPDQMDGLPCSNSVYIKKELPLDIQFNLPRTERIKDDDIQRAYNVRSMQSITSAFNAEDEEGEIFNNTYLADMKAGHCINTTDPDRLSVLQMRNALCKPHLKSSYPVETQFHPLGLSEDDIKTGSVTDDVFNDSLSQSLLPKQKQKKKDRNQTSYKKPGPPTPSKNGGRLSLQGDEFRSPNSRILKERNIDRRTTTTPRGIRSLFGAKKQDESSPRTPRSRRLSNLFRKPR